MRRRDVVYVAVLAVVFVFAVLACFVRDIWQIKPLVVAMALLVTLVVGVRFGAYWERERISRRVSTWSETMRQSPAPPVSGSHQK